MDKLRLRIEHPMQKMDVEASSFESLKDGVQAFFSREISKRILKDRPELFNVISSNNPDPYGKVTFTFDAYILTKEQLDKLIEERAQKKVDEMYSIEWRD